VTEPVSVKTVPGMGGKVFDFRGTGLLPPKPGGPIRPLVFVHHIPVVENAVGLADFEKLASILKGGGLAIQAATDAEGNVALFSRLDEKCFGHLGANHLACGAEHMHLDVNEKWTEKQMRAAAWLSHRAWRSFGIPPRRAILLPGAGHFDSDHVFHLDEPVGVQRRGHTSHENVSAKIDSHQRFDPGPKFSFKHLYELTRFFREHHTFEGAPEA
jgi:hypothetical protein